MEYKTISITNSMHYLLSICALNKRMSIKDYIELLIIENANEDQKKALEKYKKSFY